jgi:hypothetical protein
MISETKGFDDEEFNESKEVGVLPVYIEAF